MSLTTYLMFRRRQPLRHDILRVRFLPSIFLSSANTQFTHLTSCYDKCKPETRPQPPACPAPALPAPPKPPISISYSTSIKTITKTNIATITYTGTVAPTVIPVPLPTSVSIITEIITITTDFGTKTKTSTKDNCSTRTVCIDYIDKCGQTYGGCVPDCLPWPTFSAPPCPRPTTATATATATGVIGG